MCGWDDQPMSSVKQSLCDPCMHWWRYHVLREHDKEYFQKYNMAHHRALSRTGFTKAETLWLFEPGKTKKPNRKKS